MLTNVSLMQKAKKVVKCVNATVYCYRLNPDSVFHRAPWAKRTFEDGVLYLGKLEDLIIHAQTTADRVYITYLLLERLLMPPVTGRHFRDKYWTFLRYYLRWFVFKPATQIWLFKNHRSAWIGAVSGARHFLFSIFKRNR